MDRRPTQLPGRLLPPSLGFAEAMVAQSGKILGRRLVAHSGGHLGPHDATGEQTTTDGPFVRIKGDDVDAPPAWFRAADRVQQSL
jgi:hypothetical protein